MFKFIRRWLDRSTPEKRAQLERQRAHWAAVAAHAANSLLRSAQANRYGKSDVVYVDRLKHFSDHSAGFIHRLVAEEIEKEVTKYDLRHFSPDTNGYQVGFHLALTDKETLRRLRLNKVAL